MCPGIIQYHQPAMLLICHSWCHVNSHGEEIWFTTSSLQEKLRSYPGKECLVAHLCDLSSLILACYSDTPLVIMWDVSLCRSWSRASTGWARTTFSWGRRRASWELSWKLAPLRKLLWRKRWWRSKPMPTPQRLRSGPSWWVDDLVNYLHDWGQVSSGYAVANNSLSSMKNSLYSENESGMNSGVL